MLRGRIAVGWTLFVALGISGAGISFLGPAASAQDQASRLKQQIASALKVPWQITDFEAADPAAAPWQDYLKERIGGYVAICENTTETVAQSGDKSGSGNAASRHPRFQLWLMNRSASLTPEKIQSNMSGPAMMARQSVRPNFLGLNDKIMVACLEDCSAEQVKALLPALQLKPFPK